MNPADAAGAKEREGLHAVALLPDSCGRQLECVADDERLREAERGGQRAELAELRVLDLEAEVGAARDRRKPAVADRDDLRLAVDRLVHDVGGLLRVGPEAGRDQQVAGPHHRALLDDHPGEAVHQVGPLVGVAQRVGEVGGDREGAAQADEVNGVGLRDQFHAALELGLARRLVEMLQRRDVALDEVVQEIRRRLRGAVAGALVVLPDALGIARARGEGDQLVAEQLLHVARAVVAEGLGEAHDRRGLDLAALGDDRERLETDVIRVLERVGGDLLEPRGKGFVSLHDARAQRFDVVSGRHGDLCLPGQGLGHEWDPDRFKFRTDIPRPRNIGEYRTKVSCIEGNKNFVLYCLRIVTFDAQNSSTVRPPPAIQARTRGGSFPMKKLAAIPRITVALSLAALPAAVFAQEAAGRARTERNRGAGQARKCAQPRGGGRADPVLRRGLFPALRAALGRRHDEASAGRQLPERHRRIRGAFAARHRQRVHADPDQRAARQRRHQRQHRPRGPHPGRDGRARRDHPQPLERHRQPGRRRHAEHHPEGGRRTFRRHLPDRGLLQRRRDQSERFPVVRQQQ